MIQTLLRVGTGSVMILVLAHSNVTSTSDTHRPIMQIKTEAAAVQVTPQIQPAANKTPVPHRLHTVITLRQDPIPSPEPSVIPTPMSPSPSPFAGADIWTPLNSHCQSDCFVDLTAEWVQHVADYYQGSFETAGPDGVGLQFKGLPPAPLDHYACEYFHVAGYLPGIEACKGVE